MLTMAKILVVVKEVVGGRWMEMIDVAGKVVMIMMVMVVNEPSPQRTRGTPLATGGNITNYTLLGPQGKSLKHKRGLYK